MTAEAREEDEEELAELTVIPASGEDPVETETEPSHSCCKKPLFWKNY